MKPFRTTIATMPALLLLLALLLTSCQDQPLDSGDGGTLRIDTTVVTRIDTVILRNSDTVFVRRVDTTYVDRTDTVEVTVIKRDTILDTVVRKVIDTIEVPREIIRLRKGRLRYFGQDRTNGTNGAIDSFSVDISESINYRVIDSAGELRGVGLSFVAPFPARYRTVDIGLGRTNFPYAMQGATFYAPLVRTGSANLPGDTVGLNHHPFALPVSGDRSGGMIIAVKKFESAEVINLVTGGVVEVDGQPGSTRYVNVGRLSIDEIDRAQKVVFASIDATFYIADGSVRTGVVPVEVRVELELGW